MERDWQSELAALTPQLRAINAASGSASIPAAPPRTPAEKSALLARSLELQQDWDRGIQILPLYPVELAKTEPTLSYGAVQTTPPLIVKKSDVAMPVFATPVYGYEDDVSDRRDWVRLFRTSPSSPVAPQTSAPVATLFIQPSESRWVVEPLPTTIPSPIVVSGVVNNALQQSKAYFGQGPLGNIDAYGFGFRYQQPISRSQLYQQPISGSQLYQQPISGSQLYRYDPATLITENKSSAWVPTESSIWLAPPAPPPGPALIARVDALAQPAKATVLAATRDPSAKYSEEDQPVDPSPFAENSSLDHERSNPLRHPLVRKLDRPADPLEQVSRAYHRRP